MKKILSILSVVVLLVTTIAISGVVVFAAGETETVRVYNVTTDIAYRPLANLTVLKESEVMVGAVQGELADPWGRSAAQYPQEQTHRHLVNGQYMTFKFEVDPTATKLLITEPYFSYQNWNYFGVQLSADGTNWLTVGDFGSNTAALGSGWKWNECMDETWGRGGNNTTVMSQCQLNPATGLKVVYARLVSSFNNGDANGSTAKPYKTTSDTGMIWYNNFFVDIERPVASVTGISVKTSPKTDYVYNTNLDVAGGELEVTWSSGVKTTVAMTAEMVTGFDGTKAGAQSLTVTYGGLTTSYTVNVGDRVVSGIELSTEPTKKAYALGEALNVTGGVLTVSYEDGGATTTIDVNASMVTGFSSSAIVSAQTITVTYVGFTDTYTISVAEKDSTENKGEFNIDSSSAFGLEIFEKAEQESRLAEFILGFNWEKYNAGRGGHAVDHLTLMKEYSMAYSFFPFGIKEDTVGSYVNIEPEGFITYEIDLPDRATDFNIQGWGAFKRCTILASKDGGKVWYTISTVGKKSTDLGGWQLPTSGMDGELVTQTMVDSYKANIKKVMTGNAEKKFLLKIVNGEYGSVMYANMFLSYVYNTGSGTVNSDLPLVDADLEKEITDGAAVDQLINAIGTVTYNTNSKALIDAARTAYDALSEGAKAQVSKLLALTAAEAEYTALEKAAEEENSSKPSGEISTPTEESESSEAPDTGVNSAAMAVLLCGAGAASIVVITRKRHKKA